MNSKFYKIVALVFLFSIYGGFPLRAQVRKYDKVKKVGKCIFNFDQDAPKRKYRFDRSARVVFSDRANNTSYKEAYFQRKHSEQGMLTPFFILGEKNGAYRLVVANENFLGRPKGLKGILMGTKYRFKDIKSPEYVGWISKDRLLFYDHSMRDPKSNKPLKYLVGVDDVKCLFNLDKLKDRDSVYLYEDPLLKKKSKSKVAVNQIVYPYKKDAQGKAFLISNFPTIGQDSVSQIYGWIPVKMLHSIGSGIVYKKNGQHAILDECNRDSLFLLPSGIRSQYLYTNKIMNEYSINVNKLIAPIYVWDQTKGSLISLKGTDIPFSEIDRMELENQTTNIHLIVDECELGSLRNFVSTFQNIWMLLSKYKEEKNASFSFASLGNDGAIYLNKTKSFADWVSSIKEVISTPFSSDERTQRISISDVIQLLLQGEQKNFENNIFIIIGEREHLLFQNDLNLRNLLAKNSSKILFVKPYNDAQSNSQDYILTAKRILSDTEIAYKDFIKGYMVDNNLFVKNSEVVNIPSEEDNIYVYEAPKNSLFNGGIVFPSIGEELLPLSLEVALDSILLKTKQTDSLLVNSLREHEKEVGVFTSRVSAPLKQILRMRVGTSYTGDLSRSSLKDVFLSSYPVQAFDLNGYERGLLLSKNEIENLIENYRILLPRYSHRELTNKDRRVLKRKYRKVCRSIRRKNHSRVITMRDFIPRLFFCETGVPFINETFRNVRIKRLRRAKILEGNFSYYYWGLLNKLDKLEDDYQNNRFIEVDSNSFFVPLESLL